MDRASDDVLTGPTRHRPGTPGKIAVMRARAERELPLFHDEDHIDVDDVGTSMYHQCRAAFRPLDVTPAQVHIPEPEDDD